VARIDNFVIAAAAAPAALIEAGKRRRAHP